MRISGEMKGLLGLERHEIDLGGACLSSKEVRTERNCSARVEAVEAGLVYNVEDRISLQKSEILMAEIFLKVLVILEDRGRLITGSLHRMAS